MLDALLSVLFWVLPAGSPVAVLGAANYATPYTFTTLAGRAGVAGNADGTNNAALFNLPPGVAVDSEGNIYVADQSNETVRKVTPAGVVTTLAGRGGVSGSADGTNGAARFDFPCAAVVDSAGNLYVADLFNQTIRKVTPVGTNWVVTTLAGRAGEAGYADGTNSAARFNYPNGLAVDRAGSNVYVADTLNHTIRKVTAVGTNWVVTTLAGRASNAGYADGTNSAARFNFPGDVAVDSAENLYVTDGNSLIRQVTLVGTNWAVTTLAGWSGAAGYADGTNSAARFNFNASGNGYGALVVDNAGNLYVGDWGNNTVRKVAPVGTNRVVTTLAGRAGATGMTDGTGSAALFNSPTGVAVDSAGNIYVTDQSNDTIRKGFPAGSVPSPFLQSPSLSAGQFGFGISGLPGLAVIIESSSDVSSWEALSPSITLVGGTNYYVSTNPPQGVLFYRARVR